MFVKSTFLLFIKKLLGDGQSARSMALSGNAMKIPVLWAKGGIANLNSGGNEVITLYLLFKKSSILNKPSGCELSTSSSTTFR